MAKLDFAECPHCGKKAKTKEDIERLFGYRINGGIRMVQSWCKGCR